MPECQDDSAQPPGLIFFPFFLFSFVFFLVFLNLVFLFFTGVPAHSYNYQLLLYKNGALSALSNELSITTMDTTSHEYQWEIYSFGGYSGSSYLLDVAVINENDIWAVGKIDGDSLNPEMNYKAVHWDGNRWDLKQINFYLCPNGTYPTPYPIKAIFAFNENDIWFTRGASFVHWNRKQYTHDCTVNNGSSKN